MPSKVLVAIPSDMLREIDRAAKAEHRTRSDLIRESLRRFMEEFKKKEIELSKAISG
jgi:metal-responsive CopG/Arc/MetJ family transcriptional regulator